MKALFTRHQALSGTRLCPFQEVHISHIGCRVLPRRKLRQIKSAAQPSPEEAAKMQEAMQRAMKDPQAILGPVASG